MTDQQDKELLSKLKFTGQYVDTRNIYALILFNYREEETSPPVFKKVPFFHQAYSKANNGAMITSGILPTYMTLVGNPSHKFIPEDEHKRILEAVKVQLENDVSRYQHIERLLNAAWCQLPHDVQHFRADEKPSIIKPAQEVTRHKISDRDSGPSCAQINKRKKRQSNPMKERYSPLYVFLYKTQFGRKGETLFKNPDCLAGHISPAFCCCHSTIINSLQKFTALPDRSSAAFITEKYAREIAKQIKLRCEEIGVNCEKVVSQFDKLTPVRRTQSKKSNLFSLSL